MTAFPNIGLNASPRETGQAINHLLNRALYPFERLPAAPSQPKEGCTYYDLTLHKARTFDGTVWNSLW